MIITGGALGEQPCWPEPWMRFSAPTGLAVAVGPLVGGAIVDGASWQWIFWMNVPIGVAILPFARTKLTESKGTATRLDWPGLVLASLGLFGIVLGVVRGNAHGWTSMTVLPPMVIGAVLVAAFVAWELRGARNPMLPMRLFRSRGFTMTNTASLLMYFGMFGSIFLLAQFLQVVQHYSPLEAGLRTLPWTGMPMLVAPIAGALSGRIGGRPLLAPGLLLQAIGLGWLALIASPAVPYLDLVPAFVVSGVGMSLFFAPVANVMPPPRCGAPRRASPPARTTRYGNWAACSASRCSARCSRPAAATRPPRRSSPG